MTGYLLIFLKKKNILGAMLKCEKDCEFPFSKSRIIHILPIQILKCQYHILDERMKKISELELRREIE